MNPLLLSLYGLGTITTYSDLRGHFNGMQVVPDLRRRRKAGRKGFARARR